MSRRARSRVPHRSLVRPTGRGTLAIVLAPLLLLGAEVTGLALLHYLASALLVALGLSGLMILLSGVRLDLERRVQADAVRAGGAVDVQMRLVPTALFARVPLGRGVVRSYLPAALGGHGDLPLAPSMPHSLVVRRRGVHELGPCGILVRDVLGLFHLRRIVPAPAQVVGLPAVEEIDLVLAQRLGRALGDSASAGSRAQGDPGPIARVYVPGDDIRRMHWKASARTGRLMTREDEPSTSVNALIVLDTRAPAGPFPPAMEEAIARAQDRAVDHAATALLALRGQGYDVTVLDASGDRIVAAGREHPLGASAAGGSGRYGAGAASGGSGGIAHHGAQADAISAHAALLALAAVGFGDTDEHRDPHQGAPGPVAVALAIGAGDGEAFADLDLDRFAGSAPRRLALAVLPEPRPGRGPADVEVAGGGARGSWRRVEAGCEASLREILRAVADAGIGAAR
ncbi:DUF58 domain-containing protein [Brachybacterium phenoliresistens]|uniref:DUF58 domain-containing protein n=1 Tax=Brachybacterium phenoliresistens TaxID=396014 RepID=Z9JUI1_9MICO|nr:DUF58 domain-containing protein [Brachybacterium phenoliresistens]EWS81422.1 hypothetical protein BF93_16575 [Brachybacterium phenoliresistens]